MHSTKAQLCKLRNHYEIALEKQTKAIFTLGARMRVMFANFRSDFTKFYQLATLKKDTVADILGVVVEVRPVETIISRAISQ
ncbi:unnamed protein product [Rhizoctonia solani]|uniref:Uncharacterized protein n=1 Tax=Rhizoctonia solani TaxID=456999 RepID=A0A8H2XYZ2_9AGAM|nr:unnamed protein product [Rhizoctonia solani]